MSYDECSRRRVRDGSMASTRANVLALMMPLSVNEIVVDLKSDSHTTTVGLGHAKLHAAI